MVRLTRLILVPVLLAVGACAKAPPSGLPGSPVGEAVTIQLREPVVGDVIETDRSEKTRGSSKDLDFSGAVEGSSLEDTSIVLAYRETILETTASQGPTKVKREYKEGQFKQKTKDSIGPAQAAVHKHPFLGKA